MRPDKSAGGWRPASRIFQPERTAMQLHTRAFLIVACLAAPIAAFLAPLAAQQPAPDTILFNGKIFTSDTAHPYVQALAIRGERIVATGDSGKIQALVGPRTRRIDLAGRVVIPGINDAHNHLGDALAPANTIDLGLKTEDPSWAEIRGALSAKVAAVPRGTLIEATIGPKVFHDVEVTRDSLDKISHDDPVYLGTLTGHAYIMNSAALAKVGIHEDQRDPMGGRYERSADGRLTGVVREYATFRVNRSLVGLTSEATALKELHDVFLQAAKWGITSIQDMSDAIEPGHAVALFEKTPTPIRIRVMRMPMTTPAGRDTQEGRSLPRHPAPLITVSGTKWLLDGVPLEFTFDPRESHQHIAGPPFDSMFHDLPTTFPESEMKAMLRESLENNDPLLLHVSGYGSAARMLEAMESMGGAKVWNGKRIRFEHGDGLFPDLVPRVKELGIVVVQNPVHLNSGSLLGGGNAFKEAQPLRSLLAAGIPVALGSDGPMNPYLNIMFAVTHENRPSEAITREQAVVAYTLTSAYAEFAEKDKGSLEPGKLADLAVLSQDIFTVPLPDLPKTESVLTMVGGKTVYDAGILQAH
jgi:predicted amidohydrolase YtcJ